MPSPYRSPDDPRKVRRLPMIDRLTIKTPCNASWDAMVGDERVRHCCQCNRNVYDLTAMHADEAEAFLEEHLATTGTMPCARLYQRPDGRVMTSQCPTAVDRRHRRRAAGAIAVAAAIAGVSAHAVIMHVPKMTVDEPTFVRDRDGVLQIDPVERDQVMLIRTMLGTTGINDDHAFAEAPHDELIPGTITLRTHKSPLERIARSPRVAR